MGVGICFSFALKRKLFFFFQAVDNNLTEEEKREKEMEGKEGRRCVRRMWSVQKNKKEKHQAGQVGRRCGSDLELYIFI